MRLSPRPGRGAVGIEDRQRLVAARHGDDRVPVVQRTAVWQHPHDNNRMPADNNRMPYSFANGMESLNQLKAKEGALAYTARGSRAVSNLTSLQRCNRITLAWSYRCG